MKRFLRSVPLAAAIACVSALSACAAPPAAPDQSSAQVAPPRAGGDRDAHGCIGSAGYAWCEATAQCERPWELAKQKGFANSAQAYEQFCRNGATQ
ncbi:hypothetical protein [Burkholderia pseudomultivorans]|uniref:hypothetical protein n=1 Tax=Burkholderia pseudomultivorans TaxID=1207504 RepID=UPI00075BCCC8|nr:hypothetical protein [Burkholderia pseudomultivorans]KVG68249.1 hypothetical protein WS80_03320 [Burkholderia pseudomultivorans]